MRSYLLIVLGAALAAVATAQALAGNSMPGYTLLAQNTGSVDRTLGNGSMGTGAGIERLPEQSGEKRNDREVRDQRLEQVYEQSNHGDTDPDMEHRPRRTLGDRDQD
ncbi:MAG: hypothetical protein CMK99_06400 [Pseudomonas sp.]|nr:hypothetical protein [Pseudomonas sp.]|tara:strand:- start:10318 stop:10638 length:321 start_codon:yes stop_codon:yes gene_type:complete